MKTLKTLITGVAAASALASGIWAVAATGASAEVVCNRWNECWHVRDHYDYPPAAGVVFHNDDWRWHGNRYHWVGRPDHGYYRQGVWITF